MKSNSGTIRNLATALLCITLAVCAVIVTYQVRAANQRVTRAADELQCTAAAIREYTEFQTKELRSERNQKAIAAGIASAATLQALLRLVNTTTVPRLNRTLEESAGSVRSLNLLIAHSDHEINSRLLPNLNATIQAATESVR